MRTVKKQQRCSHKNSKKVTRRQLYVCKASGDEICSLFVQREVKSLMMMTIGCHPTILLKKGTGATWYVCRVHYHTVPYHAIPFPSSACFSA